MTEELKKPPVIELDDLLKPISEELPSGEGVRYSGLYDQIAEARRADHDLNQGDWQTELKVADFRKVIDLSLPALLNQTKDLQIAAWLSEALTKQFGFAGLRDGLKLMSGLQETFWDTLYPEMDEGDMEARANAIAWLDKEASEAARRSAITGKLGYSFLDSEDAKRFDLPESVDHLDTADQERINDLKAIAAREKRVTAEQWNIELKQTRRASCEQINFTIDECWEALQRLNAVIEDKFERNQAPGLSLLQNALDEIHTRQKKILEEKRLEEPDDSDDEMDAGIAGDETASGDSRIDANGVGPIQSRKAALKRLGEIAAFFQKTEPHSPVAYLVQRAVKWGNMPLDGWLQDVIKDETVLYQLRQTLGLDTGSSSGPDYVENSDVQGEEWSQEEQ
ncbi:MAG: type VI secretion system protein TssA [Pyrinomonadaceae bacterium]